MDHFYSNIGNCKGGVKGLPETPVVDNKVQEND